MDRLWDQAGRFSPAWHTRASYRRIVSRNRAKMVMARADTNGGAVYRRHTETVPLPHVHKGDRIWWVVKNTHGAYPFTTGTPPGLAEVVSCA